MIDVVVEVKTLFLQLLLHFKFHHADAGAGVSASSANDLEYVVVGFPIRLNFVRAEQLPNSVEVIDGKLDALVNLLTVQVHHFIDKLLSVQVIENFLLRLFFFELVLFLELFELGNLLLNLLLRALSVTIEQIEFSLFDFFLDNFQRFKAVLLVFFCNLLFLIINFHKMSDYFFRPNIVPQSLIDVVVRNVAIGQAAHNR